MTTEYMREALDLARKGRSLASPNPMVGAVLVRDGDDDPDRRFASGAVTVTEGIDDAPLCPCADWA